MVLYSPVGRCQSFQNLFVCFFQCDGLSNKFKTKLQEVREFLHSSGVKAVVIDPLSIYLPNTCNHTVLGNQFHCFSQIIFSCGPYGRIKWRRLSDMNPQSQELKQLVVPSAFFVHYHDHTHFNLYIHKDNKLWWTKTVSTIW